MQRYTSRTGCAPIAPPSPEFVVQPAIVRDCKRGYKAGYTLGKGWALVATNDNADEANLACVQEFLKEKNGVFAECARKGVNEGFKKFWDVRKDGKMLKELEDEDDLENGFKQKELVYYRNLAKAIDA